MSNQPLTLAEQGSFFVGGTIIKQSGEYNTANPMSPDGKTLHGDHAYISYQKPANPNRLPLVFLHGAGQSGKTWESTPDGREGFGTLFLRRGFRCILPTNPDADAQAIPPLPTPQALPPTTNFGLKISVWVCIQTCLKTASSQVTATA